ncbi:hypothetical protein VOLCADRAFT_92405 [Volvox carteri f. nagariensis]|uniref:Uncharacterized protein n=1 Tax=Volvox carteri f. nagariensis TaxID=3068 RepID=D8TZK7_VOLCA|nr:uncharacterized protein VOLCADRAFT_92405 [Volvox carteri f. nagariensis]EFJ47030.1 hypothetical protein VOLCADRAFT_92405 [Volvox carteri f. nagariensis]|eukprot:XP_002951925.1 hypothetical protein VOLCADRAFT_92405 [Volvox carteri f. nagariensis]
MYSSCLYYVPWISTFCVCIGVASLGVWAYFTRRCRSLTIDALDDLGITAKNISRINSALIATAIAYLVLAILIFFMSLWRSFIEASHDALGHIARGAKAFLILNFLTSTGWLAVMLWLVLLIMGNTLWGVCLYVIIGAINQAKKDMVTYGTATWLPSRNQPCPGQCLNLTPFTFVTAQLKDACICDTDKLDAAQNAFQQAYDIFPAVAVGNFIMLLAGLWLLVNFACQFSHAKRERELLSRIESKMYSELG